MVRYGFRRAGQTLMSALPPKSGHWNSAARCLLCAKSRHCHLYSINSSARMRSDSGTSTPSLLAVLRFTSKLILVGNSTGRSAGLVPLRIWLNVQGGSLIHMQIVRAVCHQSAVPRCRWKTKYGPKAILGRSTDDVRAFPISERARLDDDRRSTVKL